MGAGEDRAAADYRFEGLFRTAGAERAEILKKVGERSHSATTVTSPPISWRRSRSRPFS